MSPGAVMDCCPLCGSVTGQFDHCASTGCNWFICAPCRVRYNSKGLYLPLGAPPKPSTA